MKTLFKLSAVALALAATGVSAADFEISNSPAVVTPSTFVAAHASDVAAAHRAGFSGQYTNILTMGSASYLAKEFAPSANFGSKSKLGVSANSYLDVRLKFYDPVVGGVDAITKHGGVLMTDWQSSSLESGIRSSATNTTVSRGTNGIVVRNDVVTAGSIDINAEVIRVPNAFTRVTYKVTPGSTHEYQASFSSVANAPTMTEQYQRSAYLLGSAAIIQSKFSGMTSSDVVKVMDQNRGVGGAFNLSNSLAATRLR